ncbi:P-loop containing nucleoside triphosphate hydrolase protein [Flagelloscypha sp. PMI_526]|nr:P-loop containing nucleoside triphosphate hydrolase protein [Flagelloscypha sp. PMI_526]
MGLLHFCYDLITTIPRPLIDYGKVVLIASLSPSFHVLFDSLISFIFNILFVNALFEGRDESYEWVLSWLSEQPAWNNVRDFEVSTWSTHSTRTSISLVDDDCVESATASRKVSLLPSVYSTYRIWWGGTLLLVTRRQGQTVWGGKEHSLQVRALTFKSGFITPFLKDARDAFIRARDNKTSIYALDRQDEWHILSAYDKRSLSSIVLDPGTKELLLDDAKDFLANKDWYRRRGIPFRRGYLLYGSPGSGKTSLIHAIAGEMNLNLYPISLSKSGLDDNTLADMFMSLPDNCIAVMEDIDVAFSQVAAREGVASGTENELDDVRSKDCTKKDEATSGSRITLSGLLNVLDGVGAKEGRIIFATTNCYHKLDPALTRPGRMDLHIEFKNASREQASTFFREFYMPSSNLLTKQPEIDHDDKASIASGDSGYDSFSNDADDEVERLLSISSTQREAVSDIPVRGTVHTERVTGISIPVLSELGQRFSEGIPEREFSMAELQGYLMMRKTNPVEAVLNIKEWVTQKRQNKLCKAGANEKEERGWQQ